MWQKQVSKSSFGESVKALEADIQHANSLAASLPRDYSGDFIQMRLSYSPFAPFLLYWIEWMDYSCTDTLPSYLGLLHVLIHKVYVDGMPSLSSKERKATLREFYAVIYPSLRQLESEFIELEDYNTRSQYKEVLSKKRGKTRGSFLIKTVREMMNVGYAWRTAPRWYCRTVGTPCASVASMTGMQDHNPALFAAATWQKLAPQTCGF